MEFDVGLLELLVQEFSEISSEYSYLETPILKDSLWESSGELEIIDPDGNYWATFSVKITFPSQYPKVPPIIYETGGELRKNPSWHINKDGSCCVGPTTKVIRKLEYNITWKRWLDLVVMPYMLDQVHKKEKGHYVGKEHEHFGKGLLDDYREWWRLESDQEVIEMLYKIIKRKKYGRNAPCYCGSGDKHKRCCLDATEYNGIPISVFREDTHQIEVSMLEKKHQPKLIPSESEN